MSDISEEDSKECKIKLHLDRLKQSRLNGDKSSDAVFESLFDAIKVIMENKSHHSHHSHHNTPKMKETAKKNALKELFRSQLWKTLETKENGHDLFYEVVKSFFGKDRVMFFDKGIPTHDHGNVFDELTDAEKILFNVIDEQKIEEPTRIGKYIVMYIGSSTAVEDDCDCGDGGW